MGDLTATQLISEVTRHFAGRDDLTNADYVIALNLNQTRMARAHDFEELEFTETKTFAITATPANDKRIAFSSLTNSNPREIYSFRVITADGRSRKLRQLMPRAFDAEIPEPEFHARGVPSIYTRWADAFEVWQVPDETHSFTLRGSKWPTDFSTSDLNAKSDLDKKDDLLIFLTVSYLFGSLGEYERANRFFGIFAAVYKEAELENQLRPDLDLVSRSTSGESAEIGKPWLNPFVKG